MQEIPLADVVVWGDIAAIVNTKIETNPHYRRLTQQAYEWQSAGYPALAAAKGKAAQAVALAVADAVFDVVRSQRLSEQYGYSFTGLRLTEPKYTVWESTST